MNYEVANFMLGIVGAASGGVGAYVAIMRTLGRIESDVKHATEAAQRANERIDSLLKHGQQR